MDNLINKWFLRIAEFGMKTRETKPAKSTIEANIQPREVTNVNPNEEN